MPVFLGLGNLCHERRSHAFSEGRETVRVTEGSPTSKRDKGGSLTIFLYKHLVPLSHHATNRN